MSLEFEWDSKKGKANLSKHGVYFEEALTVFIFSARKATRRERGDHEENVKP